MNVHSNIIHSSQEVEITQNSLTNEWINKNLVYAHKMKYSSAVKRNEYQYVVQHG